MRYLILSTYSKHTKNSGDDLIAKSLAHLVGEVKSNAAITIINLVDASPEQVEDLSEFKAIIAPAVRPMLKNDSVGIEISDKRAKFFESGYEKKVPLFAVGAGWKAYPGSLAQAKSLKIEDREKERLLRYFGDQNGKTISCRDVYTEILLKNNGIDCFGTTGDCGLFDLKYLNKPVMIPEKIKSIAVSMPHNRYHWKSATKLAVALSKKLSCEVFCTFHSYKGGRFDNSLYQKEQGLNVINLSGGMEKLTFYDNVDLHVGFRLHAHIYFLRTRKPSLLIAEDGRGTGHLATVEGLGYPAPPPSAFLLSKIFPVRIHREGGIFKRFYPKLDAVDLMIREIESGYLKTKNTLSKIDSLWETKMRPFLETIP